MNIKINKDPDVEYKNEFMLGYTLKEVICIVVAVGVVVLATVIAYMAAGISPMIGCYIGIPFAFPIIFFGFAKPGGMTVGQLVRELIYERKTKCLTYDAEELEEYTEPVTLLKKEKRKK